MFILWPIVTFTECTVQLEYRVLIVNIHNLGSYLCPRCLIPKDHLQNLATKRDSLQWHTLARQDTKERCLKVTPSHQLIYDKGYVVNTLQVVFKSPVERLQKDWQLDWTDKGCNWTAVAGCMALGEVHRAVQDQLQLVAIETGLYRGRGIFYMKTEVFVDILYAKNTDK